MSNKYTFGEKCADLVAKFGGSWKFIILFAVMLISWITYSSTVSSPFDPFPYILLNLILSCLASVQAPFIMMSNNRQSQLDRARDDADFNIDKDTNKKVDLILEILSEKK